MENCKFEIINEEEFNADHYGAGRYLTRLGGCGDYGNDTSLGLGDWTYQFAVEVTNQKEEKKSFTVAFQPEERNNGMKNYSGYDVTTASSYGYDADESSELEEFCNYDSSVIDKLHDEAWSSAKIEFKRLMQLLKNGEIEPNND